MGASAVLLTGCGILGGSAPAPTPTPVPSIAPTTASTPTRAAAPPTATPAPRPTPSPEAEKPSSVWVANTDGEGVFIRHTPVMADRAQAYPDDTELEVIGDDVDGDGQHWKHVRAPDGVEGYVPSMYTRDTPP
jgi:hypothetical protein